MSTVTEMTAEQNKIMTRIEARWRPMRNLVHSDSVGQSRQNAKHKATTMGPTSHIR